MNDEFEFTERQPLAEEKIIMSRQDRFSWLSAKTRPRSLRKSSAQRPNRNSYFSRRMRMEPLEDRRMLAVVTVDTHLDTVDFFDGATSLREAVFATNLVGGADVIDFDTSLSGQTILLTMGELPVTDDLTIDASGLSGGLTIDASGNDPTPTRKYADGSRVFNIDDGNHSADLNVELRGLKLTGGDVAGDGGAIRSTENLVLHGVDIVGNATGTPSVADVEPNNSLETAQNVDGPYWGLESDPDIADSTTIPHISIHGTGDGTFDYYSFTIANAGDTAVFDIDYGSDSFLSGLPGTEWSTDTELFLFDSLGNLLASNDNASLFDGAEGSISEEDAFLQHTFAAAGTYIIGVAEHESFAGSGTIFGEAPDSGETYTLQISIENHSVSGPFESTSGGGIWASGPTTLIDCTVDDNSAVEKGGGIYVEAALMLTNTTVSNNYTGAYEELPFGEEPIFHGGGDGGGIWAGDILTCTDSTITGNANGSRGGGVCVLGDASFTGSTISHNNATGDGGGICAVGSQFTLIDSTVSDNTAGGDGGGILVDGTLATVTDCTISNNLGREGGGIWADSELLVSGCMVSGNETADGAFGTHGTPGGDGGGIWANSNLTVVDTIIADNRTGDGGYGWNYGEGGRGGNGGNGAGVWIGGTATIVDSTISGNVAGNGGDADSYPGTDGTGAGIRVDGGKLTLSGSTVSNNHTNGRGGGISTDHSYVTVTLCSIWGNTAGDYGGGIHNRSATDLFVLNSSIYNNSAQDWGGGIYNSDGNLFVTDCAIYDNMARKGGGIALNAGPRRTMEVVNSTVSGNTASNRGGGVYLYWGHATVKHCTITENCAPTDFGGGIAVFNLFTYLELSHTIIAGNIGTDVDNMGSTSGLVFNSNGYNLVGTGNAAVEFAASGDLVIGTGDPRLGPLGDNGGQTYTHAPLLGSPAINAGDPDVGRADGVPLYDQRLQPYARVASGRIDIGAHERQSLTIDILDVPSPAALPVDEVVIHFSEPVTGFDIGDLELTLNGLKRDWSGSESLSTYDNQTFFLSGLAGATAAAGNYTLNLSAIDAGIFDASGAPPETGDSESWATSRILGLTVNTLVDERDGLIDDGDLSLRDAIAVAVPGETIDFAPSLNGGTILLTLGELLLSQLVKIDATALPGGLTIDAAGNDPTSRIDDGLGTRVFRIDDGNDATESAAVLRGLTLIGGDVADSGGAIYATEPLTLESCSILHNSAGEYGGGVFFHNNSLSMIDTSIGNNSSGSSGGGIYVEDSIVNISGCDFLGNTSDDAGGGIRANNSSVAVVNSTISNNNAGNGDGDGGGLSASTTDLTISGSNISNNFGRQGAGIGLTDGSATVTDSVISGNSSNSQGGKGGGIFCERNDLTVLRTTVSNNSTAGRSASGGGIYSRHGNVLITDSTISGNFTTGTWDSYGGGIGLNTSLDGSQTAIIRNSTISGNSTKGAGGGVFNVDGLTIIEHCTVTNNAAPAGRGSGVFSYGKASAARTEVSHTIIAGNVRSDVDVARLGGTVTNTFVSNGYNLIGSGNASSGFADNDLTSVANPMLEALADNGGPTFTHVPLPDSPAIDAGDPTLVPGDGDVPLFDQRGVTFDRLRFGSIDIGAVEVQSLPSADFDGDRMITGLDFLMWQLGRGTLAPNAAKSDGDADGDFDVDEDDLRIWEDQYGQAANVPLLATESLAETPTQLAFAVMATSLAPADSGDLRDVPLVVLQSPSTPKADSRVPTARQPHSTPLIDVAMAFEWPVRVSRDIDSPIRFDRAFGEEVCETRVVPGDSAPLRQTASTSYELKDLSDEVADSNTNEEWLVDELLEPLLT